MSSEAPTSPPLDPIGWLAGHPIVAVWAGAFCLWVSVSLIIHLWLVNRRAGLFRKIFWSFILLIPLFGWMCYGGFFQIPGYTDVRCPNEHSRNTAYTGYGHL